MIDAILNEISRYTYPEYILAVLFTTALVRWLFTGIDRAIHPKWITFIVGVVLAGLRMLHPGEIEIFKVIVSFALATISYDYCWKIIKDKFFTKK